MPTEQQIKAIFDYDCIDPECGRTIQFNLLDLDKNKGKIVCRNCHRIYQFDKTFRNKLDKLKILILAVQNSEDILGDCNVAVTTPAGEVKIPYRLLLTRLNTLISLDCNGKRVDFNFRVEPLNEEKFK